jgi:nucleotide-binding universal stress UspA family protein
MFDVAASHGAFRILRASSPVPGRDAESIFRKERSSSDEQPTRVDSERQRVVVAIKPWQRGLPLAATRALEFAQSIDSEILLVSVVFDSIVARGLQGAHALELVSKSRLIEEQRLELETVAQLLRDWRATVAVRVVWGAVAHREILRVVHEWQADLLVVGAHEQRSALHTSLTDTHWQLMQTCSCPLLLVKDSTPDRYRTVLAAVDPSRAMSGAMDRDVLKAAQRFAAALRCQVRAVHVFPDPARFSIVSTVEVSPGVFYGMENVAELHQRAVEQLVSEYDIDPGHADICPGEPAAVIIQLMMERDVRLVVLGLSRHSLLEQLVLGSITQAVTVESRCDVLLIPHESERATRSPHRMANAGRAIGADSVS